MSIPRRRHLATTAFLGSALASGAITGAASLGCDAAPTLLGHARADADALPASPPRLHAAPRRTEPQPPSAPEPGFFGASDAGIRQSLASAPVHAVEKGRGGRTLAFKLTLADGTVGYYKPEQSFSGAHWYGEVAAYYLDRALGLGRVPPTVGRRLPWGRLRAHALDDPRLDEVVVAADGTVRGAFIWWVPEGLERIAPGEGWERWVRVEPHLGITPYQRPARFRDEVNRRREGDGPGAPRRTAGARPEEPGRDAELSDVIVFDYLTHNVDRWGGNFTNVRTRGPGGPLVFFDNGAAFYPTPRIPLMDARLEYLQRFRRSTVEAVRALSIDALRARLGSDPLAPVLDETLLEGVAERRRFLLAHVEAMRARFGDTRVFFPDDL